MISTQDELEAQFNHQFRMIAYVHVMAIPMAGVIGALGSLVIQALTPVSLREHTLTFACLWGALAMCIALVGSYFTISRAKSSGAVTVAMVSWWCAGLILATILYVMFW